MYQYYRASPVYVDVSSQALYCTCCVKVRCHGRKTQRQGCQCNFTALGEKLQGELLKEKLILTVE